MKKTISIILAIMMVATLSVSAFAAIEAVPDSSSQKDVMAKYVACADPEATYYVEVTFADMTFTYDQAWGEYDETTGKYAVEDEWNYASTNTVTVVNKSSTGVNVSAAFAAEDGFDIEGEVTFDDSALAYGETGVGTLTLEGALDKEVTDSTKIGTVTVTIAA